MALKIRIPPFSKSSHRGANESSAAMVPLEMTCKCGWEKQVALSFLSDLSIQLVKDTVLLQNQGLAGL